MAWDSIKNYIHMSAIWSFEVFEKFGMKKFSYVSCYMIILSTVFLWCPHLLAYFPISLYRFTKILFFIAVHFWAPTFKWGISIANIADFAKPPEKLSYPQQIGTCLCLKLAAMHIHTVLFLYYIMFLIVFCFTLFFRANTLVLVLFSGHRYWSHLVSLQYCNYACKFYFFLFLWLR